MARVAWLLFCMALSTAASADEVYKCVTGSSSGSQATPCSQSQVQARLPRLPDYADPPERDPANAPPAALDVADPPSAAASAQLSHAIR